MAQPTDQRTGGDFDDAIDQLRADYDTTPYTSNSFPQSAPGHLAAIAHLFGLEIARSVHRPCARNRLCRRG